MRQAWKPKPGDRMVRHPRGEEMEPVRLTVTSRKPPSRFVSTPLMIVYLFAGLIVLGTLLLLLPFTHHQGGFTPFLVALFTATSAITVTGLVVQDTAAYWTRAGHVIILGMMYLGGLGIMTFATFLLVLIGHRVTIAQRLLVREILLVNQLGVWSAWRLDCTGGNRDTGRGFPRPVCSVSFPLSTRRSRMAGGIPLCLRV